MSCNPSSLYSQWPWWTTVPCGTGTPNTFGPSNVQEWSSASLLGTTTAMTGGGVDAFSVQVRFQNTDIPMLASAYFSFFSSADPIFPTTTITNLPTQSTHEATVTVTTVATFQHHGLSTGAQAGIGVAVTIIVIALILIGAYLFFRRRKARQLAAATVNVDCGFQGLHTKPELEAGDNSAKKKYQIPETQIAELGANSNTPLGEQTQILPRSREHQESATTSAADPETPSSSLQSPNAALLAANSADAPAPATSAMNPSSEEESEESLRHRIQRVKEERQRLGRINELAKLEDELERRLLAKREPGVGGA